MDNFRIDVTSEGKDNLTLAMTIAFGRYHKAKGYSIEANTLIFYWVECPEAIPFPFEMSVERTVDWTLGWLDTAEYGKQPDHDGDNGRGWRLYNEAWGHVKERYQAFVAIQPAWAMYGK